MQRYFLLESVDILLSGLSYCGYRSEAHFLKDQRFFNIMRLPQSAYCAYHSQAYFLTYCGYRSPLQN